jgi:mevalonate pyrophosphate decarboxylase
LHSVFGKAVLALACLAALALGGALLADDAEEPIYPHSIGGALSVFGGLEVQPRDVGGSLIDAKETIEPQVTVLLVTSDVSASPGMAIVVQTSPVFDNWVSQQNP